MQEQLHWRRILLRTEETARKYEAEIAERDENSGCPLCKFEGVIKEFEHWVLMKNKFPYDRYFTKSDMIVTKRHVSERDLSDEEREELRSLKQNVLCADYDSLLEHMPAQQSIPKHTHLHLIKYKRVDEGER